VFQEIGCEQTRRIESAQRQYQKAIPENNFIILFAPTSYFYHTAGVAAMNIPSRRGIHPTIGAWGQLSNDIRREFSKAA
jgi:hypothetical protein